MKTHLYLSLLLLFLTINTSIAGFGGQIPIGGGRGQGKPINTGVDISDADVDRLRNFVPTGTSTNPFTGLSRADAHKKVRDLRATILKLIPILRCENPKIAACVQKALETNRICIDIARPFAAASIVADDLPTCGTEPINIGILNVPCTTDLCSFNIFRLASLLLHEGLHGIQDWRPTPGATNVGANRMKVYHTREEEASLLQTRTACELIDALAVVAAGNPVPASTPKFAAKFAKAVAAKPNATTVAAGLAAQLKPSKEFWAHTALCRRIYKLAYCLYEDGVITRAQLNRIIRRSRWFRTYGAVAGLGTYSLAYLVTSEAEIIGGELVLQTPRVFEQIPGNGSDPVVWQLPPFEEFYGGQVNAAGDVIYFVAGEQETGDGILYAYRDTNADGLFEQDTFQELIRSSDLFGSFDLTLHPITGQPFGFNPTLGNFDLFRLDDLNDDGLPDQPVPIGNFQPQDPILAQDLLSIGFAPNGNTIFGYPEEEPDSSTAIPSFWSYAVANLDLELQIFIPGPDHLLLQQSPYVPIFAKMPRQDSLLLCLNGPPLHQLQVFSLANPEVPVLIGEGPMGNDGNGQIPLELPPQPPLVILDPLTGLESPVQELFPPEPPELGAVFIPLDETGTAYLLDWPSIQPLRFSFDLGDYLLLEDLPPLLWYPGDDVRTFFRLDPQPIIPAG